MQTKRKYSWGYLALAVVVCGVLLVSWGNLRRKQRLSEPVELSVIVRWQSSEVWENIRRGIELAAQDYNLDVMYITLTDENSVQEQETMIDRETQLDTQAIFDLAYPLAQGKDPVENFGTLENRYVWVSHQTVTTENLDEIVALLQ